MKLLQFDDRIKLRLPEWPDSEYIVLKKGKIYDELGDELNTMFVEDLLSNEWEEFYEKPEIKNFNLRCKRIDFKTDNHKSSLTPCPYFSEKYIGSWTCGECDRFIFEIKDKNQVLCMGENPDDTLRK